MAGQMNRSQLYSHSQSYALCSTLITHGISPHTLPIVQQLDELKALLPVPCDFTSAAAVHQQLFGMNIFAHESFFLDDSHLVGGAVADDVLTSYQRVGYQPSLDAGSGDHLGEELRLLSFLCAAQVDALQDEQPQVSKRLQWEQQRFLQRHLLRWLVPCTIAIRRAGDAFYAEVASLTLALVAGHWQYIIDEPSMEAASATDISFMDSKSVIHKLPTPPDLLDNQKTSLRDIADFLITPAHCGIYLSRDVISRLGRKQQLPRGFGERKILMTNLLQSAAQYEQTLALFQDLHTLAQEWQAEYKAVLQEYPHLAPFVAPWQERAQQSRQTLEEMAQLIQTTPVDDDSGG